MAEVQSPMEAATTVPHDVASPSPPPTESEVQKPELDGSKTITKESTGDQVVRYINEDGKKVKKIIRKKRRPARPQVDPSEIKSEPPPQTGTIFNIWYNKWSGGDREDKHLSNYHAPNRCNVAKDSGYTKADNTPGAYFCLFFARGVCPNGQDCEYLHRLPSTFDIYSGNVDCFGREKHSDYRDDMGGVGSFMRQNRTLYVGRIHPTDDIEEVVARHFQEWGTIERIRVLPTRGVAFVTYTTESLAQFAKEAMAHQSLDNEETLNVRWATVDPNPAAQKREARKVEEQAAEAIRRALPESFVAELEGRDPEAKRRRKEDGAFGLQGYQAPDEVWFESEKARMAVEDGQARNTAALEAPEETLLLEQGDSHQGEQSAGGILSASTLAALHGYKTEGEAGMRFAEAPKGSGAALVGYDSDDDEE